MGDDIWVIKTDGQVRNAPRATCVRSVGPERWTPATLTTHRRTRSTTGGILPRRSLLLIHHTPSLPTFPPTTASTRHHGGRLFLFLRIGDHHVRVPLGVLLGAASQPHRSPPDADRRDSTVKGPSELKLSIPIDPSKTIGDLKEAVAAKSDVPKDSQRLIYSGTSVVC